MPAIVQPAIGLDIGGSKSEIAVLACDGAELLRRRAPTPRAYDDLIALVRTLVMDAEREVGERCSVGIGAPGSPNPATRMHRNSNLTCMNGRAFQADAAAAIGRPVRVSNDANCMTLSESMDGAGSEVVAKAGREGRSAVVFGVIIGTGVGGGLVVGGRVVEGHHGIAGEWGHNPMPPECADPARVGQGVGTGRAPNAACYCGRVGCIEQFLSGSALERRYASAAACAVQAGELAARAEQGDPHARAALAWYAQALACALGTVVNVLDPDAIVLAGGLSNLPDLHRTVQGLLPQCVFSDACATRVVRAQHGDSSGVRGAAWLGRTVV